MCVFGGGGPWLSGGFDPGVAAPESPGCGLSLSQDRWTGGDGQGRPSGGDTGSVSGEDSVSQL